MRTINEDMHAWSLNEVVNHEIAPVGTPERDEYDALVADKVRMIKVKNQEKEKKISMHIMVPVYLRDAIRQKAQAHGESANAYINNIFAQVVTSVPMA